MGIENPIESLKSEILSSQNISGYTHCFYNSPARFSPKFSKSIIDEFTSVGDIVLDPFMGGGTSIVEATALGRKAVGIDINELAVFVSRVKTNLYSDEELNRFRLFANHVVDSVSIRRHFEPDNLNQSSNEVKNVDTIDTWRLTRLVAIYKDRATKLELKLGDLFRCVLLKATQWAFDNGADFICVGMYDFQIVEDVNIALDTLANVNRIRPWRG